MNTAFESHLISFISQTFNFLQKHAHCDCGNVTMGIVDKTVLKTSGFGNMKYGNYHIRPKKCTVYLKKNRPWKTFKESVLIGVHQIVL